MQTRIYAIANHALIRRGLSTLTSAESDMAMCGQAEDAATMKLQPDLVSDKNIPAVASLSDRELEVVIDRPDAKDRPKRVAEQSLIHVRRGRRDKPRY